MSKLRGLLIVLGILSSTLARHSRNRIQKNRDDLTKLFSNSQALDSSENENDKSERNETRVCETHHCRQLAKVFSEAMDKSIDPCVDFYKFTCGGWEAKKPIPKYESTWSRMKLFEAALQHHLRDEMEKEPTSDDILPIRQAKKWYRSCMDTKTRNTRGINPIVSILIQTGGWPMIMDAEEWYSDQSWKQIEEHYMRLTGEYTFYKITPRPKRPGFLWVEDADIWISPPELPLDGVLPLEYRNYTGEDLAEYAELIAGIAKLFIEKNKANVPDEQLNKDIDDLIKFEKRLYMAINEEASASGITKFERTMEWGLSLLLDKFIQSWDEFTKSVNENANLQPVSDQAKIDWRKILKSIFDFASVRLHENSKIAMSNPSFFFELQRIIESTKKRTIVNYVHWKFVSFALRYTIDEVKDIFFDLVEHEYGIQERSPRWLECVQEMEMEDAAAFLFVENYFNDTTAKAANEMTQNIKKELGHKIDNSNWLSSEAKEMAKKKLNAMKTLLGFPDWFKNHTAVVNHYKGLNIDYDYLDNILSFMRYEESLKIRDFAQHKGVEKSEWDRINPITLNAFYEPSDNTISTLREILYTDIPAVVFQIPLFGDQVPNYVNYGTTGFIIGHEISHGFDKDGVHHGISGDTRDDLWEEDMMYMYYERAFCFIKQFDNYFGGKIIPPEWKAMTMGELTVSENIADTTGVQSVFSAYMKMRMNEAPNGEMKLPGFENFSDEQMFFLSFAGAWCTVTTPEYEKRKKTEPDVHSPPHLRVLGAVSNTLAFAEAFNCPKDSPMNPEDKCNVWTKPGAELKLKPPNRKRHHYRNRFDIEW